MGSTAQIVARAVLVLAVPACASRETPEHRVTRLRQGYRVEPAGYEARRAPDGATELAARLLVVNTGREGLPTLTVVFHVQGADGADRLARRVPLDVTELAPGVTAPRLVVIPGVEVRAGEDVLVELEEAPPPAARGQYPEYQQHGPGGPS